MEVGAAFGVITLVNPNKAVRAHVGHQDPGHSQRYSQYRRDLGH
jgi:hypothetical protein